MSTALERQLQNVNSDKEERFLQSVNDLYRRVDEYHERYVWNGNGQREDEDKRPMEKELAKRVKAIYEGMQRIWQWDEQSLRSEDSVFELRRIFARLSEKEKVLKAFKILFTNTRIYYRLMDAETTTAYTRKKKSEQRKIMKFQLRIILRYLKDMGQRFRYYIDLDVPNTVFA